jgi:hypothetical protein
MRYVTSVKSLLMWGVVALNVFLLAVVINRYSRPNTARAEAPVIASGDYLTAPGVIAGQSDGVVFVLDTSNGWLSIAKFNSTNGTFASSQPIDINRLFANGAGAVDTGAPKKGH